MLHTACLVAALAQLPAELDGQPGWLYIADHPLFQIPDGVESRFHGQTSDSNAEQVQTRVAHILRVGYNRSVLAGLAERGVGPGDFAEAIERLFAEATTALLTKDSAFDVSCCVELRLDPQIAVLDDDPERYPVGFVSFAEVNQFLRSMAEDEALRDVTTYIVGLLADPLGDATGDLHALGGYAPAGLQRMVVLRDAPGVTYVHEIAHLNEVMGHWSINAPIPHPRPGELRDRVMFAGGPNSGGRDLDELSAIECTYLRREVSVPSRKFDFRPDAGACRPSVGVVPVDSGLGGCDCSYAAGSRVPGWLLLCVPILVARRRLTR